MGGLLWFRPLLNPSTNNATLFKCHARQVGQWHDMRVYRLCTYDQCLVNNPLWRIQKHALRGFRNSWIGGLCRVTRGTTISMARISLNDTSESGAIDNSERGAVTNAQPSPQAAGRIQTLR